MPQSLKLYISVDKDATFCGYGLLDGGSPNYHCPSEYMCNYKYSKNGYCVSCNKYSSANECRTEFGKETYGFTECKSRCLGSGNKGQIDYYFQDGTYADRQREEWVIWSTCLGGITIRSRNFDLEDGYDWLTVNADSTEKYTGNTSILQDIHQTSFTVNFDSDIDIGGHGFKLDWECAQTGDFGIIEYEEYKANKDETWEIESTCLTDVRVVSILFDTELGSDNLTINGKEYSGSQRIDQRVSLGDDGDQGIQFDITFSSDFNDTEKNSGFILHWFCDPIPRILKPCSLFGTIENINGYNFIYADPKKYTYNIIISKNEIIKESDVEKWSLGRYLGEPPTLSDNSLISQYNDGSVCHAYGRNRSSAITWTCSDTSIVTGTKWELQGRNPCEYGFIAKLDCCKLARRQGLVKYNSNTDSSDGNLQWNFTADCPVIEVTSEILDVGSTDVLRINDKAYTGSSTIFQQITAKTSVTMINIILNSDPKNSDDPKQFSLKWKCLDIGTSGIITPKNNTDIKQVWHISTNCTIRIASTIFENNVNLYVNDATINSSQSMDLDFERTEISLDFTQNMGGILNFELHWFCNPNERYDHIHITTTAVDNIKLLMDECIAEINNCGDHETCQRSLSPNACICNDGFVRNGSSCQGTNNS